VLSTVYQHSRIIAQSNLICSSSHRRRNICGCPRARKMHGCPRRKHCIGRQHPK